MRWIPALSGWGPPHYRTWVTLQSTTHMELFVPHSLRFMTKKKNPCCVSYKKMANFGPSPQNAHHVPLCVLFKHVCGLCCLCRLRKCSVNYNTNQFSSVQSLNIGYTETSPGKKHFLFLLQQYNLFIFLKCGPILYCFLQLSLFWCSTNVSIFP